MSDREQLLDEIDLLIEFGSGNEKHDLRGALIEYECARIARRSDEVTGTAEIEVDATDELDKR